MSIDTPENKAFIDKWMAYVKKNNLPGRRQARHQRSDGGDLHRHSHVGAGRRAGAHHQRRRRSPGGRLPALQGAVGLRHHDGRRRTTTCTSRSFIGEVKADGQFHVVWKTDGPIRAQAWSPFIPDSAKKVADWTYPWACGNCTEPKFGAGRALVSRRSERPDDTEAGVGQMRSDRQLAASVVAHGRRRRRSPRAHAGPLEDADRRAGGVVRRQDRRERPASWARSDDPRAIPALDALLRRSPAARRRRARRTSGTRKTRDVHRSADRRGGVAGAAAAQGGRGRATRSAAWRLPVLAQLQLGSPDGRGAAGGRRGAVEARLGERGRAAAPGAGARDATARCARRWRWPWPASIWPSPDAERAARGAGGHRQERQRRLSFDAAADADRRTPTARPRARHAGARRRGARARRHRRATSGMVELRRQPAARPDAGQRAAVRGARPGRHLRPAGRHQHGPRRDADAGRLRDLHRPDASCTGQRFYLLVAIPVAFLATGARRHRRSSGRSSATSTGGRSRRCWPPGASAWGSSRPCASIFGAQNVDGRQPGLAGRRRRDRARAGAALEPHRRRRLRGRRRGGRLVHPAAHAVRAAGPGGDAEPRDGRRASASPPSGSTRWMFGLGSGIAGLGGVALSQLGNVGPELGQSYIIDSFMVVVLGGVGRLAGAVAAALGLGVVNKLLEPRGGRGAGQDRRAGLHHPVHPAPAAGDVRAQGAGGGLMRRARVPPSRDARRRAPGRARCGARRPAWLAPRCSFRSARCPDYLVPAVRQVPLLRHRGAGDGPGLGLRRASSASGHGLFFALGGYGMGMYLMRSIAGEGVYRSDAARLHGVPRLEGAALVLARLPELPVRDGDGAGRAGRCWRCVFGWFAFRSRIRGVYFSIVTQALTYAAMLLFFQNATGFGGNNGLTDFKRILGCPLHEPGDARARSTSPRRSRCVGTYLLCRFIVTSRLGRVLTRRPRRRAQDPLLRLRVDPLQAVRLDAVGDAVRRWPARSTCRRSGSSTPARCSPRTRSRWRSGWRSAGAARWSARVLGAWIVNGGKSWLTGAVPVGLALRAGRRCSCRDAVPARGVWSGARVRPSCGARLSAADARGAGARRPAAGAP